MSLQNNAVGVGLDSTSGWGALAQNAGPQAATDLNDFGIRRSSGTYAADTNAAILRANWERSRPQMDSLITRMMGLYKQGPDSMVQSAGGAATGAFDRGLRSTGRDMQRYGVNLSADQQKVFDQQAGLERGIARVGAKNMAGRAYDDLKQQIAIGS